MMRASAPLLFRSVKRSTCVPSAVFPKASLPMGSAAPRAIAQPQVQIAQRPETTIIQSNWLFCIRVRFVDDRSPDRFGATKFGWRFHGSVASGEAIGEAKSPDSGVDWGRSADIPVRNN